MATYYNSSNQRDVMQTIYLMEPGPVPYPESSSLPNHMVYLNYSSGGSYSDNIAGNSQSHQNCVDLPVLNTMLSQDSSQGPSASTQSHQGILSNLGYGLWRDGRNELLFMQPATNMQAMGLEMNNRTDPQIGTLHGGKNISAVQGQGLSLSLGTQIPSAIPVPSFQCPPGTMDISFVGSQQSASGDRENNGSRNIKARNTEYPHSCSDQGTNGDLLNNLQSLAALKQMTSDPNSYGLMGHSGTTLNSRYLLAAQKLLDEVVNVRKAVKHETEKHQNFISVAMAGPNKTDGGSKGGSFMPSSSGMGSNPQEVSSNSTSDLSPAERQDLQNKLIKFLSMLDEVDRRYKQYYHQMHIVVSSFDVIGGNGAAKPYTALALQTISRQFRCLRDAISSQIHVARKSLGEQDDSNSKGSGGIPRLRLVDQQLRQQRALQQIGMVQHHSWRPQRGLPESSVSILRAWLFEHFLHPYPKDSDKIMLARQTGLTRSQVSNWFINARVRLWKPMVEEMYKEEIGDAEIDSTTFSENASKAREETGASEDREDLQSMISSTPERSQSASYFTDMKSNQVLGVELSATTIGFHHDGTDKDCTYGNMKPREERPNAEDCHIVQDALVEPGGSRRFMAYHMAELSEFGNRNVSLNDFGNRDVSPSNFGNRDVSLTLGLQHCDAIPVSSGQQTYVTVRGDHIYSTSASVGPTDSGNYDCVDLADRRHRFGSSHLLHDFVA